MGIRSGQVQRGPGRLWSIVLVLFIFTLLWYALLNIFYFLDEDVYVSSFLPDPMPIFSGIPMLFLSIVAAQLRRSIRDIVDGFDAGAAFLFPSPPDGKRKFLDDLTRSIRHDIVLSAVVAGGIALGWAVIIVVGDADQAFDGQDVLLLLGLPLFGLAVGSLFGPLTGYGRLLRLVERNGIRFAGLSALPAREALRKLNRIVQFAIVASAVAAIWLLGWMIVWAFPWGTDSLGWSINGYECIWKTQFQALWFVAMAFFLFVGVLPARAFRWRLHDLGGAVNLAGAQQQIAEAVSDRASIKASDLSDRVKMERVAELTDFIDGLGDEIRRRPLPFNPSVQAGFTVVATVLFIALLFVSPAVEACRLVGD